MAHPRSEAEKITKDIGNLFRLRKEVNYTVIKDYIEYESNGDGNKAVSVEEYFNKIRPYLKDHK